MTAFYESCAAILRDYKGTLPSELARSTFEQVDEFGSSCDLDCSDPYQDIVWFVPTTLAGYDLDEPLRAPMSEVLDALTAGLVVADSHWKDRLLACRGIDHRTMVFAFKNHAAAEIEKVAGAIAQMEAIIKEVAPHDTRRADREIAMALRFAGLSDPPVYYSNCLWPCPSGYVGAEPRAQFGAEKGWLLTAIARSRETENPALARALKQLVAAHYPDHSLELILRPIDGVPMTATMFETCCRQEVESILAGGHGPLLPVPGSFDYRHFEAEQVDCSEGGDLPYKAWIFGEAEDTADDFALGCLLVGPEAAMVGDLVDEPEFGADY